MVGSKRGGYPVSITVNRIARSLDDPECMRLLGLANAQNGEQEGDACTRNVCSAVSSIRSRCSRTVFAAKSSAWPAVVHTVPSHDGNLADDKN